MPSPILNYFVATHLPEALRPISEPIDELARRADEHLPDSTEKAAKLHRLLEAKNAMIQAALALA